MRHYYWGSTLDYFVVAIAYQSKAVSVHDFSDCGILLLYLLLLDFTPTDVFPAVYHFGPGKKALSRFVS